MSFDPKILLSFLTDPDTPERVGFVLKNDEVIELTNICPELNEGAEVAPEDYIKYENDLVAMWHTHPGEKNELSIADYHTFRAFSNIDHYVVGTNGVIRYYVQDGMVLREKVE